MTPEPFKYDFFVSYTTREDEIWTIRPMVEQTIGELERRGFSAWPFWLDVKDLRNFHGDKKELHRRLIEGMDQCVAMLAFTSPNYVLSKYCQFEYRYFNNSSCDGFIGVVNWKYTEDMGPLDFTINCDRPLWRAKRGVDDIPMSEWYNFIAHTAEFLSGTRSRRMERWEVLEIVRRNENRR
jgi:hypothetical protein